MHQHSSTHSDCVHDWFCDLPFCAESICPQAVTWIKKRSGKDLIGRIKTFNDSDFLKWVDNYHFLMCIYEYILRLQLLYLNFRFFFHFMIKILLKWECYVLLLNVEYTGILKWALTLGFRFCLKIWTSSSTRQAIKPFDSLIPNMKQFAIVSLSSRNIPNE
jgi:hypothetical protein